MRSTSTLKMEAVCCYERWYPPTRMHGVITHKTDVWTFTTVIPHVLHRKRNGMKYIWELQNVRQLWNCSVLAELSWSVRCKIGLA